MNKSHLYQFISKRKYAVLSTVTTEHLPEAAVVGIAVLPDLRIIFDTVTTSRKYRNLLQNPAIAFVIGWEGEQTVQYEGIAHIPNEAELDELLPAYFDVFPDGIDRKNNWKDIAYFCVQPRWVRYSDFICNPPIIEEMKFQ